MKTLRWFTLLALCVPASAQDDARPAPAPRAGTLFAALDKNADGKLSMEEIDLAVASLRHLDRNKDGVVSAQELNPSRDTQSGGPPSGMPRWKEIDRNGDGKVSREEAPERMKERFDRVDRNGDGLIDRREQEELDRFIRRARAGGGRPPGSPGAGRPGEREGAPGSERRSGDGEVWKALSERYDSDENGEISSEEYTRGAEKFARLDRNGDEKLTASDFRGGRGGRGGMSSMVYSRLARMADADENEELTRNEWKSFVSSLEVNEDGVVAREPFVEVLRTGGAGRMAERMIGMLDQNRDRKLMKSELEIVWSSLDGNEDGVVKDAEFSRPGRGGRGGRGGPRGRSAAPEVGTEAPDFELPYASKEGEAKGGEKVRLSTYQGKKPVALVFGSYT